MQGKSQHFGSPALPYRNYEQFTDALLALVDQAVGGTCGDALTNCYNTIISRLALSASLREVPFLRLCANMAFSYDAMFCLCAGIASSMETRYSQAFARACARLDGICTIEGAISVLYGPTGSKSELYRAMERVYDELKPVFFFQDCSPSLCALLADDGLIKLFLNSPLPDEGPHIRVFKGGTLPGAPVANEALLSSMTAVPPEGLPQLICVCGEPLSGRRTLVRRYCAHNRRALVELDLGGIDTPERIENLIRRAGRLRRVYGALLLITGLNSGGFLRHAPLLFDAGAGHVFVRTQDTGEFSEFSHVYTYELLELELPDVTQRHRMWISCLKDLPLDASVDLWTTANRFYQSIGAIERSCIMARRLSAGAPLTQEILDRCCRANVNVGALAVKRASSAVWDDLVLPEQSKSVLHQACDQIKYRHIVLEQWGYGEKLPYGRGLAIMLYGPPGTGKTMAAGVIAKTLGLELMVIDLSQVMDKYIGETEKNLGRIFDRAQKSNVVLFFDEADALFGKRMESKGASERFANVETGYLLQRIEQYDGLSILATNLLSDIDEAFLRRIRFLIEFPFPNEENRFKIWQGIFPKELPVSPDVDFRFLAKKFEFSGGSIKNIALNAAFMAASSGDGRVTMKELVRCVRQELLKSGNLFYRSSMEQYQVLLDD